MATFGHHRNTSVPLTLIQPSPKSRASISRPAAPSGVADRNATKNRDGLPAPRHVSKGAFFLVSPVRTVAVAAFAAQAAGLFGTVPGSELVCGSSAAVLCCCTEP